MEKVVLIDGHSILNRAFYGVPELTNSRGLHTNAVYGFLNIMFRVIEDEKADCLAVAFDLKEPTFRHKMYEAYKGTRKPMPEELREQVPVIKEVLSAMGIPILSVPGYEADDVLGTLDWMTEHAGELKIDEDKIAVMGESAGGTLAANCCLMDQKERIKLAVYIYGALDLTPAEKTPYHWDYSLYDMYEGQKDYIMNRLFRFKELAGYMEELYVQNGYSTMDGNVSPLYAEDLSKMPETLMIEAEFDYFKICNDEFVKRLTEAGINTEVILYEGLDHGFYDRIGSLPQAEDCIREIAERVKRM